MTRRMADSVTPANLPEGMDLYGAYDDGTFRNAAAVRARFPTKTVLAITVNPSHNFGDVLDVENGDARPTDAPGWTRRRRLAGHDGPLNYCSWEALGALRGAFAADRTTLPGIIVAGYPAPDGNAIPVVPGVNIVGHQWTDHAGLWDESCMADYLPGIDPVPSPAKENKDMELYVTRSDGTGFVVAADLSHKVGLEEGVGAALAATGAYGVVPEGAVPDAWINNIPTLQNV